MFSNTTLCLYLVEAWDIAVDQVDKVFNCADYQNTFGEIMSLSFYKIYREIFFVDWRSGKFVFAR